MRKKLPNFLSRHSCSKRLKGFSGILFLAFFVSVLFSSCTTMRSLARKGNPLKLHLYPAKKIPLIATSEFTQAPVSKKWNLVIEKKNKKKNYSLLLDANQEQIAISIFSDSGEQISGILYKGTSLIENFWSEKWGLTAKETLSVFQCCFYDANQVAQMLNSINFRLSVENSKEEEAEIRRIYNKRNCIMKFTKKDGYIRYRNYEKKFILYLTEI